MRHLGFRLGASLLAIVSGVATAAAPALMPAQRIDPDWDVSRPRGAVRHIAFETEEGTGMSVDVARDGSFLVFDLLASIYRMPLTGGPAVNLTADSGIALNFHPAVSPDGRQIAFVSDRSGQNNLYRMDADGSNVRPVFLDPLSKISEPRWTPDGKAIVAVRGFTTPGRGWHRTNTQIWLFPVDGSPPRQLVAGEQEQFNSPSLSPDGRTVFFHTSFFARNRFGTQVGHRLQQLDLASGRISEVRPSPGPLPGWRDYIARSEDDQPRSGPAETAPLVSPDGRYLAFAREMRGRKWEYRGHSFGPTTALVLRDLRTGDERILADPVTQDLTRSHAMYSYRTLPGFAWTGDGRALVASIGGKIVRIDRASGAQTPIPFRAQVTRDISEMTRSNRRIDDAQVTTGLIQWPSGAPDGNRLVFAAFGRIWVADRATRAMRPLTTPDADTIDATPSWSPDGRWIAFARWSAAARGQVWLVRPDGSGLKQVSRTAGEYAYPAWRPDSLELVAARGPASPDGDWPIWKADAAWQIVRIDLAGTGEQVVTTTNSIPQPSFTTDGRIVFAAEDDRKAAADLRNPWPSADALAQVPRIVTIRPDGARTVIGQLSYPQYNFDRGPSLSPDGAWLAYQADHEIFVVRVPTSSTPFTIDPDVNAALAGARRVSSEGGAFFSWRDTHTLQFASGGKYVTVDVRNGQRVETMLAPSVPRIGGAGALAFVNARILPMSPETVIPRGTIVIQDARITCVGDCAVPRGATTIDLAGKTVIPGLIDVHEHQTTDETEIVTLPRPPGYLSLAYGVTTIVDPATDPLTAFPIADLIESGRLIGPRSFSSADLAIFASTMMGQRISLRSLRDAELEVNRRVDWGAITIKNYRPFSRDAQQKLIAAARERSLTVTGEGGPLFYDLSVIMDGQTGWEHYIADLPVYSDFTRFAGLAGITYSPTVNVAGTPQGAQDYWRPKSPPSSDAKYRYFAPESYIRRTSEASAARNASATGLDFSFPVVAEGLKDVMAHGGHGSIGEHGEQFGIGSHWEIWSYATALTPMQALRAATIDGACFVGLENDLGSISPGKIADLVIIDGDPLTDIKATARIDRVMKAGILYDAGTLARLWPTAAPPPPRPWRNPPSQR